MFGGMRPISNRLLEYSLTWLSQKALGLTITTQGSTIHRGVLSPSLLCRTAGSQLGENPAVVREVESIMRFWLDKGIDGFRMDVINLISKVPGLPDAPVTVEGQKFRPAHMYYACSPRLRKYLSLLRRILDAYDACAVGEMPWAKKEVEVLNVVSAERKELNMIFQSDM